MLAYAVGDSDGDSILDANDNCRKQSNHRQADVAYVILSKASGIIVSSKKILFLLSFLLVGNASAQGLPHQLSTSLTALDQFQITQNGDSVVFNTTDHSIYSVPINGGATNLVSMPEYLLGSGNSLEELLLNDNGRTFELTADSEFVIYLRHESQFDRGYLLSSQLSQSSAPILFYGLANHVSYKLTSNGKKVIYFESEDGVSNDIRVSKASGAGSPLKLSGSSLSNTRGGKSYKITPDNR